MRNFLRALRFAARYKGRIIISILCAFVAGGLWGLNFSVVYPVLELLDKRDKNLQQWADAKIAAAEEDIVGRDNKVEKLEAEKAKLQTEPQSEARERRIATLTDQLSTEESRLASSRARLWRYRQLEHYVIRHLPADPFNTLAVILATLILASAVKGVFEFCQEYLVGIVVAKTVLDLRDRFYRTAIRQDLRQVNENGSAELMSRFTNDMESIGNGMKLLFGRVIGEPLRALACLSIAMWISWQLTLMFILVVPAAIAVMTSASKKMKRASRKVLERMGSLYKILQETFQGLRIVKAFTMERYERKRFHDAAEDYAKRSIRVARIDALTGPMVELTGMLAITFALLAGAYLVLTGEKKIFGLQLTNSPLETATLIWLYANLIGMADPIRKLSSVYTKIQSSAAACDRVFAAMDKAPEVLSNAGGPKLGRHSKSIEFQNICFSYTPDRQILTNVCLTVTAGETVAILGANGSGKSTLLNLLPRFYDPDHGTIFIDGIDIRKANLRSLRSQIALVSQDPILFDDTMANNIQYGNRTATAEQIEAAAKQAFAHEFILTKGGYDAKLGDLGGTLSGGEKQRIALARAILRDPSILILDEFSSAIDPVSDRLIHDALQDFKKGRTTFFITHKMHTVSMADRIVVLDNHAVAAVGTHAELIASAPVYRGLYEAQMQSKPADPTPTPPPQPAVPPPAGAPAPTPHVNGNGKRVPPSSYKG
jgi:ATP-binding cassette, subfamily B, bacterial MsbA